MLLLIWYVMCHCWILLCHCWFRLYSIIVDLYCLFELFILACVHMIAVLSYLSVYPQQDVVVATTLLLLSCLLPAVPRPGECLVPVQRPWYRTLVWHSSSTPAGGPGALWTKEQLLLQCRNRYGAAVRGHHGGAGLLYHGGGRGQACAVTHQPY